MYFRNFGQIELGEWIINIINGKYVAPILIIYLLRLVTPFDSNAYRFDLEFNVNKHVDPLLHPKLSIDKVWR